jgi:hypothetical protein
MGSEVPGNGGRYRERLGKWASAPLLRPWLGLWAGRNGISAQARIATRAGIGRRIGRRGIETEKAAGTADIWHGQPPISSGPLTSQEGRRSLPARKGGVPLESSSRVQFGPRAAVVDATRTAAEASASQGARQLCRIQIFPLRARKPGPDFVQSRVSGRQGGRALVRAARHAPDVIQRAFHLLGTIVGPHMPPTHRARARPMRRLRAVPACIEKLDPPPQCRRPVPFTEGI